MFERFTDRARRAVVLAQEEARMLNHDHIGTEHLLLGLISEGEGLAAKLLESFGMSLEEVRGQVGAGPGNLGTSGLIPFTPQAKNTLELSLRESMQLGHNYIGTEHILLGLARNGSSTGSRLLLQGSSLNLTELRERVLEHLAEHGTAPGTDRFASVRFNDEEYAMCRNAANKAGQPLDAWLRDRVLEAARAAVDDSDPS